MPHLDEALQLKAFSDEKDAQNVYVQEHDARFEKLLRQLKEPGFFKQYGHKRDIVKACGEPIFCRADEGLEKCLYRRIARPGESPKVYFYYDAQGALVRWISPTMAANINHKDGE